nr:hypothetical protein [Tanacetum cinerariifolium]
GESASSTTPPTPTPTTTVESAPRLSATAKGKQPSRAITPIELTDTGKGGDEVRESEGESDEEEIRLEEEKSFDPIPRTPEESKNESNDEDDQELRLSEEARIQEEEEADELDAGVESIFMTASSLIVSLQSQTPIMTPSTISTITTSGVESIFTTASSPIVSLQTPTPIMTPSTIATVTTSSDAPIPPTPIPTIPGIVPQFMNQQMTEAAQEAVKSQVQAQVTRILPRIEESVNAQLEAEVLTRSSHSSRTLYAIAADLLEMELKKILIDKMEGNNEDERMMIRKDPPLDQTGGLKDEEKEGSMHQLALHLKHLPKEPVQTTCQMEEPSHSVFETGAEDQPIVQTSQHPEWFSQSRRPPSSDRDWNKTLPAAQGNAQSWISELARQTDARSSFNELLDTPIDFSNFIMNRLSVDTLTPELLAGPNFELMRRSCNSLTKLEYHLEEVYKATTDQLYWVNPEGQQYLHKLLQPLSLIPDNRGRREPLNYDKYALWGVSHWGRKRQQFYGYTVNRESDLDVYSKQRIIAVIEPKIVEWHNYKHLDWNLVRRDDDKIYKFKEGDFKRLRLQDIEDMLLLLVQGKLSNLTVEERFAFNVSLRMFTRSIVIQRRVEDLQLGVESYQKRLNLTKPDTYRSDLKRRKAYTAYLNPRGFIYQNKEKKNRLMRIDELHKFSDGTLNDVRSALDDRLKGIRMQYVPTTIWRRGDKDRAAAMIQAIDKMLKIRRIMRSLEKFDGGRLYEGDFRTLQRTI